MPEIHDYSKLRVDVLRKLVKERNITCKDSKDDMVRNLTNLDNGEYKPDYSSLKVDELKNILDERNILYKSNKDEMVKTLVLDDEGKYIRETIYNKNGKGFDVGIDIKNKDHLHQMSVLIFKKEGRRLNMYSDDRIWHWSEQKLL